MITSRISSSLKRHAMDIVPSSLKKFKSNNEASTLTNVPAAINDDMKLQFSMVLSLSLLLKLLGLTLYILQGSYEDCIMECKRNFK